MMASRRHRSPTALNIWPGFVDALAALLLLLVFVVMVFTLAQVFLAQTVANRDDQLSRLSNQLAEIATALRLERDTSAELRGQLDQTRSALQQSRARETELSDQVAALQAQSDSDQATIETQLRELGSLQQDIAALRSLRAELEDRVGELENRLDSSASENARLSEELGAVRDRSQALQTELADAEERTRLAQQTIDERDIRIRDLEAIVDDNRQALAEEQELSASARAEVERLNDQVARLREQLDTISTALALEESTRAEREAELEELGERLNTLLAERVNELEQYRSEFFGRLRQVLVDNPDIRIEGDRFVLPSELFFDSASATLGDEGRSELNKVADTLSAVAAEIPDDLGWILRIDGHTDRRPINTERFPSNWELSTARAVSVVRYLAERGIPAERMAAAGFGEHHPINPANTEAAFQQNRRIEIKLTQR